MNTELMVEDRVVHNVVIIIKAKFGSVDITATNIVLLINMCTQHGLLKLV